MHLYSDHKRNHNEVVMPGKKKTPEELEIGFQFSDLSYERFKNLHTKAPAILRKDLHIFTGTFVEDVFRVHPNGEVFCTYNIKNLQRFAYVIGCRGNNILADIRAYSVHRFENFWGDYLENGATSTLHNKFLFMAGTLFLTISTLSHAIHRLLSDEGTIDLKKQRDQLSSMESPAYSIHPEMRKLVSNVIKAYAKRLSDKGIANYNKRINPSAELHIPLSNFELITMTADRCQQFASGNVQFFEGNLIRTVFLRDKRAGNFDFDSNVISIEELDALAIDLKEKSARFLTINSAHWKEYKSFFGKFLLEAKANAVSEETVKSFRMMAGHAYFMVSEIFKAIVLLVSNSPALSDQIAIITKEHLSNNLIFGLHPEIRNLRDTVVKAYECKAVAEPMPTAAVDTTVAVDVRLGPSALSSTGFFKSSPALCEQSLTVRQNNPYPKVIKQSLTVRQNNPSPSMNSNYVLSWLSELSNRSPSMRQNNPYPKAIIQSPSVNSNNVFSRSSEVIKQPQAVWQHNPYLSMTENNDWH
jgi:hypothetical protein